MVIRHLFKLRVVHFLIWCPGKIAVMQLLIWHLSKAGIVQLILQII